MATPAAYSNLALVRPRLKSAVEQRQAAHAERAAEAKIKADVEQAHRVLSKLEAREAALGALIKDLQKRKNATTARAVAIEERILREMALAKLDKLTGTRCTLSARPAPPALEVVDEKLVPDCYVRQVVARSVDKVACKAAILRGEDIAGVKLTQKMSLVRK